MKKRLKKAVPLCLTLFLLAGCGGTANTPVQSVSPSGSAPASSSPPSSNSGAPSYLNLDSQLPIVKEGESVTLNFAVRSVADSGTPDKVWMWKFVEEKMNIKVNVEQVLEPDTYRALAFNSGTMPDVMIDLMITPVEMVTYGMQEKMLLPLDTYINETYMPTLAALYAENPSWRERISGTDGHIYSLGMIADPKDVGGVARLFINGAWLQEHGLKIPETLEDFTSMLALHKSQSADNFPLSGSYKEFNPSLILLNAFGILTNDASGKSPALRNGEVVIPYGDREGYGEYLKTMNDYYSNGYLPSDFYTLNATAVNAMVAEGKSIVYANVPHVALPKTFTEWVAVKPLTSSVNNEQIWPASQATLTAGGFAITSACKYPEAAARFADFFYDKMYYEQYGAMAGSDETFGITSGWTIDPSRSGYAVYEDFDKDPKYAGLTSSYTYRLAKINGWPGLCFGYEPKKYPDMFAMQGLTYDDKFNLTTGEGWYRSQVTDNLLPHTQMGYPSIAFYDEDTAKKIADLKTVLDVYAETESAKFITGARPLSELDDYFSSLESMGLTEYLSYYQDYYAALNNR